MQKISNFIATCGGLGYMRPAPGTYGSLLALPIAWGIHLYTGLGGLIIATICVIAIGTWAAHKYAQQKGEDDPQSVIIDEVAGQMLTLWVAPPSLLYFALGFAMFRLFDITKPPPILWIEKRYPGGWGIMADDLAAAFYAMIALWLLSVAGGVFGVQLA